MEKKKILFVCLGNICRSPAAEGIMRKKLQERGLSDQVFIDSAGILDYHEGELPDPRMRIHGSQRGYDLSSRSRPVTYNDFFDFDWIIGMDNRNIDSLKRLAPDDKSVRKIHQMTEFSRQFQEGYIPDPYYGGDEGFEHVLDLLEDACEGLIDFIFYDSANSPFSYK